MGDLGRAREGPARQRAPYRELRARRRGAGVRVAPHSLSPHGGHKRHPSGVPDDALDPWVRRRDRARQSASMAQRLRHRYGSHARPDARHRRRRSAGLRRPRGGEGAQHTRPTRRQHRHSDVFPCAGAGLRSPSPITLPATPSSRAGRSAWATTDRPRRVAPMGHCARSGGRGGVPRRRPDTRHVHAPDEGLCGWAARGWPVAGVHAGRRRAREGGRELPS